MPHDADDAAAPSAAAAPAVSPPPEPPLATWTRGDDKLLEMLLVCHFPRWDVIASRLPGNKTPEQASQRYQRMVEEVTHVLHALRVETPREWDAQAVVAAAAEGAAVLPETTAAASSAGGDATDDVAEKTLVLPASSAADGEASSGRVAVAKMRKRGGERKKPEKWTKQEHDLFLRGLEKYGKGKWKAMASEYLTTKSASQIASHHQKHRNRSEQRKRNACKRSSIHDITDPIVADGGDEPAAQRDEPNKAPGQDERGPAADQGGEATREGDDELVGAVEEFPDEDDPGTLFT